MKAACGGRGARRTSPPQGCRAGPAGSPVPLVVLPSGIWRLGLLFAPDKRGGSIPAWAMNGYVVLLTLASEVLAFTAVGLVARWGEVFPRWMPRLRGRRVPTAAAVIPATIGATVLTLVFTIIAIVSTVTQSKADGDPLPADYPEQGRRLGDRLLLRLLRPSGPMGPDARRPDLRVLAPAQVGDERAAATAGSRRHAVGGHPKAPVLTDKVVNK